jgi:malate dehydrogenase (oxaloacetate-decarboxylating)(NADP+)
MDAKRNIQQEALDYHANGRPGKITVVPTKNTKTQRDLSLAYSPGVAEPCMKIKENPDDIYKYTAKGNLVAVISNGTAVLGLGNIGPEASKPVMEGKGVLFKIFADIDVFDLELNTKSIDEFVTVVKALEPTFGGVNLEDIKAPECFEIERRLKEEMHIPVMHDDQHGTAMISGAALLNAIEIVNKDIAKIKMVVSGAGAAAVACTKMYINLGVKKENITMFDVDGVINHERTDLDESRMFFAQNVGKISMADALVDADVFIGLSAGNILSQDMVKSMAKEPIVFSMANPNPEITYDDAVAARPDIIMATGRSDYPNQVNNVLGFPFIFRGALDVRATAINEEMKMAAAYALAALAKQPVPEIVTKAYGLKSMNFGRDYIIPKPLDPRLLSTVAPAIAKAAMETGVARKPIEDFEAYIQELNDRLGLNNSIIRLANAKAKQNPKRIVFAEADNAKVLKAAQIVEEEGFAFPILLGNEKRINQLIADNNISLKNTIIIDPRSEAAMAKRIEYGEQFFAKRPRNGMLMKLKKSCASGITLVV